MELLPCFSKFSVSRRIEKAAPLDGRSRHIAPFITFVGVARWRGKWELIASWKIILDLLQISSLGLRIIFYYLPRSLPSYRGPRKSMRPALFTVSSPTRSLNCAKFLASCALNPKPHFWFLILQTIRLIWMIKIYRVCDLIAHLGTLLNPKMNNTLNLTLASTSLFMTYI